MTVTSRLPPKLVNPDPFNRISLCQLHLERRIKYMILIFLSIPTDLNPGSHITRIGTPHIASGPVRTRRTVTANNSLLAKI